MHCREPQGSAHRDFLTDLNAKLDDSAWDAYWGWDCAGPQGLCERVYHHLNIPKSDWQALKHLPTASSHWQNASQAELIKENRLKLDPALRDLPDPAVVSPSQVGNHPFARLVLDACTHFKSFDHCKFHRTESEVGYSPGGFRHVKTDASVIHSGVPTKGMILGDSVAAEGRSCMQAQSSSHAQQVCGKWQERSSLPSSIAVGPPVAKQAEQRDLPSMELHSFSCRHRCRPSSSRSLHYLVPLKH